VPRGGVGLFSPPSLHLGDAFHGAQGPRGTQVDATHGKAPGRVARWRLRLAEFNYVLQTQPGASHHAADTMSRISTPAVDDRAIPDAVPCLALPNSSAAWQLPPQTEGGLLSPLTLAELLEGQAADESCKEV